MADESEHKRPWHSFRYGWQFWTGLAVVLLLLWDTAIFLAHAINGTGQR